MHAAAFLKVHGQKSAAAKTAVDTACAMALQAVDEARVDKIGVFEPRILSHSSDLGQFTATVLSGVVLFTGLDYWTDLFATKIIRICPVIRSTCLQCCILQLISLEHSPTLHRCRLALHAWLEQNWPEYLQSKHP